MVEEHTDELGGCGAEGFHDPDFTLFLDGDGKHHGHNGKGGDHHNERQRKSEQLTLGFNEGELLLVILHPGASCPSAIIWEIGLHHIIEDLGSKIRIGESQGDAAYASTEACEVLANREGNKHIWAGSVACGLVDADHGEIFGQDYRSHVLDVLNVRFVRIDSCQLVE